ncbi:hypothetical protein JCM11491_001726 [Sporobolomyces phaffii]
MSETLPGPLSSLVLDHLPAHPLPHLVVDPVVVRLARIETFVLLSRPSLVLQRLGASQSTIVGLLSLALVGALTRWRRQWRTFATLVGVGEAVGRTLALVDRAECAATSPKPERELDDSASGNETSWLSEAQHVLSFWTLFFSLSLFETLRTSPSKSSLAPKTRLTTRLGNSLRSLRYTYLRFLRLWIVPLVYRSRYAYLSFIQSHPHLDLSARAPRFPSIPFAAQFAHLLTPSSYISRAPSSFPQPLPASSGLAAYSTLPLAHSYFSSRNTSKLTAEVRWNVVKVLLLWTGMRKDAFGAKSVLFDWFLGPIVRNWRNSGDGRFGGGARGTFDDKNSSSSWRSHEPPTNLRRRGQADGISPRPSSEEQPPTEQDLEPPSPTSSTHSYSPRPPPIWTTRTPPRTTDRKAPPRQFDSTTGSVSEFPTPENIPYRLASSAHPLLHASSAASSVGSDSSSTGRSKLGRRIRGGRGGGRDSLLMESPPRSLRNSNGERNRMRQSDESDTTSEEEREARTGAKDFESPPRTEAEEGIQRWAAMSSHPSDAEEPRAVKSLEAAGRGWTV